MKHYTSFTVSQVEESSGEVATFRRGFVFESDERLTHTPNVTEILGRHGWGAFVGPVLLADSFTEFPEELLRGAVIHGVEGHNRFWVVPANRDPESEMSEVQDE